MKNIKNSFLLNKHVKNLINNQNNTENEEFKNSFSYKEYLTLLKPVLEVLKSNPDADIDELKHILYVNSNIEEEIKNLILNDKNSPGFLIDYGTLKQRETILCGNMQEKPDKKIMKYGTIFDLASTSKIFTTLSILILLEYHLIKLDDPVKKYAPSFKDLGNTTINDLLKLKVDVKTNKCISNAQSIEEAEQILFTLHPSFEQDKINPYTDMGAIALKYVIEKASTMKFADFVEELIIRPTNMNNTFLNVPDELKEHVVNENYSKKVLSDGTIETRIDNIPGTVNDEKAISLGHKEGIFAGHAGYFSNAEDMIKFGEALINNDIIKPDTLYSISKNENSFYTKNKTIKKCFGSLVYTKQLNKEFLGVHDFLSGRSFLSPGYCGTSLCVDPLNKIVVFVGSNRLHNRIINVNENQTNNINGKIYNDENEQYIISSGFSLKKEIIVKKALELSLQYQFLDNLLKNEKTMQKVKKL